MKLRSSRLQSSGDKSLDGKVFDLFRKHNCTVLGAGAATPVLGPELLPSKDLTTWVSGGAFNNWAGTTATADTITTLGANGARRVRLPCTPGTTYWFSSRITGGTGLGSVAIAFGTSGAAYITHKDEAFVSSGVSGSILTAPVNAAFVEFIVRGGTTGQTTSFADFRTGVFSGYTYGNPPIRNYFDSAGTDILDSVTQVDQPVGLTLDAAGVVGVELGSNPDTGTVTPGGSNPPSFSTTTRYGLPCVALGFNLSGAVGYASSNAVSPTFGPATPLGTTLQIRYEVAMSRALVGSETFQLYDQEHNIYLRTITASDAAVASMFIEVMMTAPTTAGAGSPSRYAIYPGGTFSGGPVTVYLRAVSFKQLTGNHATQPTTGSKPTLRRGLVNQLLYSQWGGGGTAPTGWTAFGGGGVEGALLPSGMRQRVFTSAASQDFIYQTIALAANTTYTFALSVDANPGNLINGALVGYSTIPAGTSFTVASSASVAAVGSTILVTIVVGATAGNMLLRVGPGSQTVTTGSVTLSAPALFQGTVTAQQILAAGGIPLTTTAPASSALGNYWWQFDPAAPGDFLQTSITTGNEGWVCAGVTFGGALGNKETVFSSGAGAANLKGVWLTRLENVSNQLRMGIGNGTELTMPIHVGVELLNTRRVVEGGWDATTVFVGVDGATTSLARTGSASPSPSPLDIGRYVSGVHFLQGAMPVTVICPTLPPPADRALIRKWVAKQQGQTL